MGGELRSIHITISIRDRDKHDYDYDKIVETVYDAAYAAAEAVAVDYDGDVSIA